MRPLDWAVMLGTLAAIVGYGVWRTRAIKNVDLYLKGGGDAKWWTIGLSIMATQASAITFLSTPGQGFEDGLGFVQFYFGVPLAMVFLSATIVPLYYRTKVFTAYEYLEKRFDLKTRQLTAAIFLLQRGLGAGLSIYAPAIILSTMLGWSLIWTNVIIGLVVIAYTVSGGTRAVNQTQQYQMAVMLGGMALAAVFVVHQLPPGVTFSDAIGVAGVLHKMQIVDYSPKLSTRYTFWSGITGGTFVALAYFGTDQSQVQRYLSGESLTQSRLGLIFNALLKVPMQLGILLIGVLVFVFFQFHAPPVFFNTTQLEQTRRAAPEKLGPLELEATQIFARKQALVDQWVENRHAGRDTAQVEVALRAVDTEQRAVRDRTRDLVKATDPRANPKDADYVFLGFVLDHFPAGLVGLLLAVILCAAMSATASALNALGTTTLVDFYRRSIRPGVDNDTALRMTKWFTAGWGLVAIGFGLFASQLDNLIQATNILGSIFYGPMLGVFLTGFFFKRVKGTAVFIATLVSQAAVIAVFLASEIGFLWYNVIGCALVVVVANLLPQTRGEPDVVRG
ncbi:MAG: sodium:solute symporter [Myxococcaceae bacterium]